MYIFRSSGLPGLMCFKYVKYVAVKGVELIALSVDVYSRGKNNLIYEKKSSKKNRFSYVWKSI